MHADDGRIPMKRILGGATGPALAARFLRTTGPQIVFLVFVLGVWESISRGGLIAVYILPPPSAIISELVESRDMLFEHSIVTGVEILLGFLVAVVVGVLLAVAVIYVPAFESAVYPWIIATQTIPKVALAPLFIVWFGFGLLPKVVIAFLIAFFPILIDTVVGLKSVEVESRYLLQSMGAGEGKIFLHLRLPTALPNLFAGMRVAIIFATVGAIVGEFVGSNNGLGYVLLVSNASLDTTVLFAALVLISAMAFIFYMIVGAIENLCIRWHVSKRVELTDVTI